MKWTCILALLLLPAQIFGQMWLSREDTYFFAATGVDIRNATIGGTVNDASYDGTFSLGYRNVNFSILAYYETFKGIRYESLGINPGFLLRPGKKLIPAADLSLSIIRRPWKTYPSLAANTRIEYHFDRFFVYCRGEYRWRTDYDFFQVSVYGGIAIKFGFN
ncbi:hypothetical protein MKO06_03010 [Gramella sp. GC03-9]|uniref:Outer membrane protein beta-barrel domain-containing protein n=1 Tax=Christiangramia oceanisediminis TaxID=2920386 RepID=A0A9X2I1D7_9FLAO|nr:hypothetical protein [Gramella oceanisediminis]MCP9198860.1 hypothetical protein [Gramella oceanisediminis]